KQKFSAPTVATCDPITAERATDKEKRTTAEPVRPAFQPPKPPFRMLRGFGVDPSLATSLDTAPVSVVTFKVPWEDALRRGPSGEYVEVVDYDPASRCFYDPVDLNDANILAQNGLAPSEGTPQFHQQMAYAVAMNTIQNFER